MHGGPHGETGHEGVDAGGRGVEDFPKVEAGEIVVGTVRGVRVGMEEGVGAVRTNVSVEGENGW